jgi:DNA-binding NarL/FixJ family response regulator
VSGSVNGSAIRILLADDHELMRSGLRGMLEAQPDMEVIGEASDGDEAVELALTINPDIVIMDIRMPRVDGIEATRRILSQATDGMGVVVPRVLVLTTFDLDEYVWEALRAGAGGFMLKDAPPRQLAEAVRTVADGESLLAPAVTKRLVERYVNAPQKDAAASREQLAELTERELEIFQLIARGRSNGEIADELFLSEATVKTHFTRILRKLELRDRVQAVVLAYECGIVVPGENES